jgi:hypothetical protein
MSVPGPPNINMLPLATPNKLTYDWAPPTSPNGTISAYKLVLTTGGSIAYSNATIPASRRRYAVGPPEITLINGTTYAATLQAINENGEGQTASFLDFQPGSAPTLGPSTATVVAIGSNAAAVSWTPPSSLPDATIFWYTINSRSNNASDPILSYTASGQTQSNYYITGLNTNSRYYFDINAVNCPGYSPTVSTNTISYIPVGDYVFESSFPTTTNTTGFVNYDSNRLMVNTPTGSGFSYLTTWNYTTSNSMYKVIDSVTTNTVSFTCSVYRTASAPSAGLLYQNTNSTGFRIASGGSILGYNWNNDSGASSYNTTVDIPTNEWFQVGLVVTSSNAKWFVNGLLANTRTASHAAVTFSNIYVGVDNSAASTRSFPGFIDNIRFYDRAITDSEMFTIYRYYQAAQTSTAIPTTVTGLQVWYDGSDPLGTGTAPSSGTIVNTWSDKSGNTRNATGTGSPTYVSSNFGYINFNGSSQYYTLSTSSFINNQYFTIFVVERLQGETTYAVILGGSSATTNANLRAWYLGDTNTLQLNYENNAIQATFNKISAAQPIRIWAFRQIASQRSIWLNGKPLSQDTNNTLLSSWAGAQIGRLAAGGNLYFGRMCDVIMYTGQLSITNMQNITAYLAQKWYVSLPPFIPMNLPTVQLWVDTTDSNTVRLSGANLTQLRDKSGRGAHMNVGAGTVPYGADGGFNVVTLSTNNYLASAITINVQNSVTAYFYVAKLYSPFNFGFGMLLSASNLRVTYSATTGQIQGGPDIGGDAGQIGANSYYINGSRNPTNINTYNTYHLVRFVQANLGISPTTQTLRLSNNSEGANIKYGEVIVIQGTAAQIELNIQRVEGYLAWKWGINSLLPSTHPYYAVAPAF